MVTRGHGFRSKGFNPIYFTPPDNLLYNNPIQEIFIDIPKEYFPEIKNYYMISNYGRVWHKYLGDFLSINIDSKGYSYKPLLTENGKQKNYRVHRLVLTSFNYQIGCENLLVNHKDLNKLNNIITNLEWVTYSGNAIHAYENNAIDVTKMYRYKYGDDELIKNICIDLEQGLQSNIITNKYSIPLHSVDAIKYGKAHTNISSNYNFKIGTTENMQRGPSKISIEDVNIVCAYFQDNIFPENVFEQHEFYVNILNILHKEINETNLRTVKRIRLKQSFTNISKNYNF